ncbi:MAG: S-methyl-5'-thioadenosine phosphorylase [Gemmobacter sp.]|uniref:S-methyl-5'-thioadenosine phosphorylase n=1 Tax=Gemmobacter sp. TaxID=1898957 RepID=UPI001A45EC43|nr:S-methyl-5'-thioadenosine phosphorylase [Gemmobacter sp.]MBL8562809.1 S-methyl-5'-thioadenosine phosphorylase [Gemmobacter sp.]
MERKLGIIGGSGVYQIDGLEGAHWQHVDTPWGAPSDSILSGRLNGLAMCFLPRHGRGHVHLPAEVPARANIAALKALGCTDLVAVSAVGSLREDFRPGDMVVLDQIIDRTVARPASFFGQGCVAHVSLADPFCADLSKACATALAATGTTFHQGSTYLAMEGPQFSSRAESRMYRQWGADVIGMTAMPEARLAREAELCYASVAMVTDYDCWHESHGAVDVAQVIAVLAKNAGTAKAMIAALPAHLAPAKASCPCGCDRALDHAVMTAPAARNPATVERLRSIAGRVL